MRKLSSRGAVGIIAVVAITGAYLTSVSAMSFFNFFHKDTSPTKPSVAATVTAVGPAFAQTPTWVQNYATQPNGAVDPKLWVIEQGNNDGWGNGEVENYTSKLSNLRIENGALVLQANKEADGSYTSARITTQGNLDFTYGKINIVAKLPTGKGVWPALWFWPTDDKYSSQPLSAAEEDMRWLVNGEMDLVEGSAWGDSDFTGSAHSLNHYPGHGERTGKVTVASPSTRYHTYSLEWTPQALKYLVDGKVFKTVTNPGTGFKDWPYDQRYHLILNIAMGGSMSEGLVSDELPLGIDDTGSPWRMQVRSIAYYPLAKKN